MGGGSWTRDAMETYTTVSKKMSLDDYRVSNYSSQQIFTSRHLNPDLDPKDVKRECCDSEEHPNTTPIILALDVTGSMGAAAASVAKKLNDIMTDIYNDNTVPDVEFCIMAIGDLECDRTPIQISQFESDIRIAKQLDEVYFEYGGGGNGYESYTAAWYMGLKHCKLDCWERGKKGIIITLGDELPNPYLPVYRLNEVTGDTNEKDVETKDLLKQVREKYDVYHISVNDPESCYRMYNGGEAHRLDKAWTKLLGDENYFIAKLDNLSNIITNIITNKSETTNTVGSLVGNVNSAAEVAW